MVVDNLELPDVTVLHHHGQEADHYLGARPDGWKDYNLPSYFLLPPTSAENNLCSPQHNLPLSSLLGIVNATQSVG